MKNLTWTWIGLLALTCFGCGRTESSETGGNTNWLQRCERDADCSGDYVCGSGLCTLHCDTRANCDANARCDTNAESLRGTECGGDQPRATCVLPCEENDDCASHDAQLSCIDGWCGLDQSECHAVDTGEVTGPIGAPEPSTNPPRCAADACSDCTDEPACTNADCFWDTAVVPEPVCTFPDVTLLPSECENCLASGGTWQPNECTTDCALQDSACYRDACPADCSIESCATCLGREECESAGCTHDTRGQFPFCTQTRTDPQGVDGGPSQSGTGLDAGTPDGLSTAEAGGGPATTEPDAAPAQNACEECLASGGTWQPQVEECTANCDIQDISCFRDQCPPACGADTCSSCFNEAECDDASCFWDTGGEFPLCTQPDVVPLPAN